MIPDRLEIWISIVAGAVILLCLAIWLRTDVEVRLARLGISFRAKGENARRNEPAEIALLNDTKLVDTTADEITGREVSGSEPTIAANRILILNKSFLQNSKIGRLVGELRKDNTVA